MIWIVVRAFIWTAVAAFVFVLIIGVIFAVASALYKKKFIVALVVFSMAAVWGINSWVNHGKFRFENFKTGEALRAYLKEKFPVGSEAEPLLLLLKDAGAECKLVTNPNDLKNVPQDTNKYYFCVYGHWQLSVSPLVRFTADVPLDKRGRVIDIYVGRELDAI